MIIHELDGGRGLLPAPAAASIHRLDADIGHRVQITEAGRTRERQMYLYNGWVNRVPGFNRALHPDNPLANHVLSPGRRGAVDSDEQAGVPWDDHGWVLTASDEPWHREYFPERDKFINSKEVVSMATGELERIAVVLGGTYERSVNGESISQRIDELIDIARKIESNTSRLVRIIGSTEERARAGDTIGTRLDAIRKQTK